MEIFLKVNKLVLFKILVLILFCIFFFYTLFSGKAMLYLNPSLMPLLVMCAFAFIAIAIVLSGELFKDSRKAKIKSSMLVFLLPLILAVILPATAVTGSINSFKTNGSISESTASNSVKDQASSEAVPTDTPIIQDNENHVVENDFVLIDGKIVPQDSNFAKWIQEIYANTSRYDGKEIDFVGFVYKDKSFKKDEFVAGRSMMICCAADVQIIGFMCKYDKVASLQDNGWYRFTCKIKDSTYDGKPSPILEVLSLKPSEMPENEYVYP